MKIKSWFMKPWPIHFSLNRLYSEISFAFSGSQGIPWQVNLCSQIRCLLRQYHIIGDSPFRSISERAFSFLRKIIYKNGCTIRVSQWEQVKGQTFSVPWQPNILIRYLPRQICKSDFCTLVFSFAFRYHICEGRRKPWRKSLSCYWRFWWARVRR